ncbi:transforming growth factor-beta-induced protein ig-h3-like [Liolophura sinensis]|uniref:transforming growth factor-beta-induced protein ig-h3-like n=1 Tax=Liolophura sinensis TaxID=3198878 RepID=UPI0031586D29
MKLLVIALLSLVAMVSPMPSVVMRAERMIYSLFRNALSAERAAPCEEQECKGTILKEAEELGLTDFVKYMDEAKLTTDLSKPGHITVFAPTNEAINTLPGYVKKVLDKKTAVERIMKYHVVEEDLSKSQMENEALIATLLGGEAKIRFNVYKDGKVITASGAPIILPETKATNGVLFKVDGLLEPPCGTIAKCLKECPVFKKLTEAMEKVNMEEMLNSQGPFTFFAPSDKAFEKIPKETLDRLMSNTTALKELLMYHVVSGTYYTAGWTDNDELTTKSGKPITVKEGEGNSYVY